MPSIVSGFQPCERITYFKITPKKKKKDPLSLSSNYQKFQFINSESMRKHS